MTGHVFICYDHGEGGAYVARLATYLTSAGVPVWYDREIVTGHRWAHVIRDQIDTAAALIAVMTPRGERSDWVHREIDQAQHAGLPIFPLLLAGTRYFRVADIQYEDVTLGIMPGEVFVQRLRDLVVRGDRPDGLPTPGPTAPQTGNGPPQAGPVPSAYVGPVAPAHPGPVWRPVIPQPVAPGRRLSPLAITVAVVAGVLAVLCVSATVYLGSLDFRKPNGTPTQSAPPAHFVAGEGRLIAQASDAELGITMTVQAVTVSGGQTTVTFVMVNPGLSSDIHIDGGSCAITDPSGGRQQDDGRRGFSIPALQSTTFTAIFDIALPASMTSIGFSCAIPYVAWSVKLQLRPSAGT
jgi:hypothetical protein